MALSEFDRDLVAASQSGLPLVPRPYEALGASLGVSAEAVRERLAGMLASGLIRRIGAVPNHYKLGFTANGMSVWDVADDAVDELGARVAALPGVSHCYRRPRHLPAWPYNLFAMLHGRSRDEVAAAGRSHRGAAGRRLPRPRHPVLDGASSRRPACDCAKTEGAHDVSRLAFMRAARRCRARRRDAAGARRQARAARW